MEKFNKNEPSNIRFYQRNQFGRNILKEVHSDLFDSEEEIVNMAKHNHNLSGEITVIIEQEGDYIKEFTFKK